MSGDAAVDSRGGGFHRSHLGRKGSATRVMMRIDDRQGIRLVATRGVSAGGEFCGRLDNHLS
jgi:hypothetical protein